MSARPILLTAALAMLVMLGSLSIDVYVPSLHAVTGEFQADPLAAQQTLSVFALGVSLAILFCGTLSDSLGRRRVTLVALVVFALTSAAAALAPDLNALIVLRLLQGICAGAGGVIAFATVQGKFAPADAQRMIATLFILGSVEQIIAPVLGGWLQTTLGWRSTFWFLAAFGCLLLAMSLRALDETLPAADRVPLRLRPIAANYLTCLCHLPFMLMAVALGLGMGGFALYTGAASPYILEILRLSETDFGWLFTPLALGMAAGSFAANRYAHKATANRLTRIGFALTIVAALISIGYTAWFTLAIPYATLPLFLYAFGIALATPGMMVTMLSLFPRMRGLAASMQGFVQVMLFALIAGLLAPLLFHSAQALAWTHLALLVAGLVAWEAGIRIPK
ncbi:MAG: multidrug effflux MFS transporter [Gallionellaceae bacterium]|nr:multidrug effflux MFS transporter [Gallionellaceae bacterium]